MITEDYVTHEVARLLEKKGFDGECRNYIDRNSTYKDGYYVEKPITSNKLKPRETLLPTLQMAMKWLREVHGLFISIEPCFDYELKHVVYLAFIQNVTDIDMFKEGRVEVASGYIVEAVYGKALKYCLEHLI